MEILGYLTLFFCLTLHNIGITLMVVTSRELEVHIKTWVILTFATTAGEAGAFIVLLGMIEGWT